MEYKKGLTFSNQAFNALNYNFELITTKGGSGKSRAVWCGAYSCIWRPPDSVVPCRNCSLQSQNRRSKWRHLYNEFRQHETTVQNPPPATTGVYTWYSRRSGLQNPERSPALIESLWFLPAPVPVAPPSLRALICS